MRIDWFTTFAQIINFLILVWLLKKYLYSPILDAINSRENKISEQLAHAQTAKLQAEKEQEEFRHKNENFEQQRAEMQNKAINETDILKKKLLNDARAEYESSRAKWFETLQTEQQELSHEIISKTQTEVFAISREVLSSLASKSFEESACEVFIRTLKDLNIEEKNKLILELNKSSGHALIRTVFDLENKDKTALQKAIKENLSDKIDINFEINTNLINGIELITGNHKISWNINDYLSAMEKEILAVLNTGNKNEA